MRLRSGDPVCSALISLIQQQHMDGGVEKERGVMMVGKREGRVERGEYLSFCHLLLPQQTHTHMHTIITTPLSLLLAVAVAGQTIVKPTGRRKLSPKWPHVLREAS